MKLKAEDSNHQDYGLRITGLRNLGIEALNFEIRAFYVKKISIFKQSEVI